MQQKQCLDKSLRHLNAHIRKEEIMKQKKNVSFNR